MDNPLIAPELHTLAQDFLWNAEHVLKDSSPFYEGLARRIANDPELLALAAHTQPHQPAMNMFFSAVHYLLLSGIDDPLEQFFADLTAKPNTAEDAYPVFRAFCLAHPTEMIALLSTRRVQTNEVARCALFLPAFGLVSDELGGQPFALVEVGSSAGLNLNWDRYGYDYGNGQIYGETASSVILKCELRGDVRPPLPAEMPPVYSRMGIDLHPNNVLDADAMLWLRALVWPEQHERAERLRRAITLAQQYPPPLVAGDALELVPRLIQETPRAVPIVLFHSFVLNQVPAEMRARYYELLAANSQGRGLFDVAVEPSRWPTPMVLTTLQGEDVTQETLATADHHGRWLEWTYQTDDASF